MVGEIVYSGRSKSLLQNKGILSTKQDAEKQDFSNRAIDILDIDSRTALERLSTVLNLTAN